MNAPVSSRRLCGRVMQWLSSRPSGRSWSRRKREVRRVVAHADVLGQADRADRVEAGLEHVAVVEVPHLGEVVEPLAVDRLLGPRRLLARQGHAERLDAVLPGGVADHAAPAAADVEQPLPGLEVELAGDQVVLLGLRLLERRVLGREDRAGVGHRRAEDQLVEAVGDVVVVVDHLGVAAHRVPQALDRPAPARQVLLRRRRRRLAGCESPSAAHAARAPRPARAAEPQVVLQQHRARRRGRPGGRRARSRSPET